MNGCVSSVCVESDNLALRSAAPLGRDGWPMYRIIGLPYSNKLTKCGGRHARAGAVSALAPELVPPFSHAPPPPTANKFRLNYFHLKDVCTFTQVFTCRRIIALDVLMGLEV
ncbi:hypothetical protein J6590_058732 [Homalodisca vitripennis]|nr:hypothetical protein J6590_058732 [Homalodisca vitripennis]